VAENKVAPFAAEVDEQTEFPQAAYDALRATDFTPRTSPKPTAVWCRAPTGHSWRGF
jgi:hypothetical protein